MSHVLGVNPTASYTTAEYALGTVAEDHLGRQFIFVKAAAAITAGMVCIIHSDFTAQGVTLTLSAPDAGAGKQVGVAMAAIAQNSYGWLCVYGTGADVLVNVLASCKDATVLNTTATAGSIDDDATAGSEVIEGLVITTTAGGQAEQETAILTHPYIGRTL